MDLTRSVTYRGFNLNSIVMEDGSRALFGSEIRSVQLGGVEGVGYTEKRALGDGLDAADVWLNRRVINISGAIYGRTRYELFDQVSALSGAFAASSAYQSSALGQKGYLPLVFFTPTNDFVGQPNIVMSKVIYARPLVTPQITFQIDSTGGPDDSPGSVLWSVSLEARDPLIYAQGLSSLSLYNLGAFTTSGEIHNLGNYRTSFRIRLVTGVTAGGTVRVQGLNTDSTFVVPAVSAGESSQIINYDSREKLVTRAVPAASGAPFARMDLLTFAAGFSHGSINPDTDPQGEPDQGTDFIIDVSSNSLLALGSDITWRSAWA